MYGGHGGTKWLPAHQYYSTMTFNEIAEWGHENIVPVAGDDCLIFSWVVSPELPRCIQTIEAWDFKYITVGFVWHKERANVGNYTMSGCEMCLIFKRGRIPSDRVRNPGQKQFISSPVRAHSQKPDEVRDRIARMFPSSKRAEFFSRGLYDGWDCYGDEVPTIYMLTHP